MPGIRALGLRAPGRHLPPCRPEELFKRTTTWITGGALAALLFALSPAIAAAQSVRGHGEISNGPDFSPSQISVNAWLDAAGVAHGLITWEGDIFDPAPGNLGPGGPSDPFLIEVTGIVFDGDTAIVSGVVVSSPKGIGNGLFEEFSFTDNSAIGLPDEIDGQPILAGNITVED
jgi:hypothetical protein